MKRLAVVATLMIALFVPTLAGEVPTVGVVTPQPTPQPTTTQSTTTNTSIATTILLTLLSLGLLRR